MKWSIHVVYADVDGVADAVFSGVGPEFIHVAFAQPG
jgi:hypothetical protein